MSGAGSDFTTALPIVKHGDPILGKSCSSQKKQVQANYRNQPFVIGELQNETCQASESGDAKKPESFTRTRLQMTQHRVLFGERSGSFQT